MESPLGFESFLRGQRLYLSLRGALVLAIENNLDVEVSRYDLLLADTDLIRAKGGGNLRDWSTPCSRLPRAWERRPAHC
jgi:hypothetical protein